MATTKETTIPPLRLEIQGLEREIRELAAVELKLFEEAEQSLFDLEGPMVGEAALAAYLSGDGAGAVKRVTDLRSKVEALQRACNAARDKRRVLIRGLFHLQAQERRERAKELSAEAQELDAKAAPLLGKLREIQGCDYVPSVNARSLSQRKRDEILVLHSEAVELERRAPQTSLNVQGDSVTELIEGILARPMTIGPSFESVHQWVQERREKGEKGRLHLTVNNSRISQ